MNGWLLASTSFCASAVEAVEALTIVLAVGYTRSWRPALTGAAWGFAALLGIVVVLGPAIVIWLPLAVLKVGVGACLVLFGLAWLRKAILRYSGRKALHDEAAIYARNVAQLGAGANGAGPDRLGFATAFNAVLLEGLEVAVIVVTFGSSLPYGLWWAGLGAIGALLAVSGAGCAVRKPLGRTPENTLKFAVGIMLTSFGTLWLGEGLGISWWGADAALGWIVGTYFLVSAATIAAAKRRPLRAA